MIKANKTKIKERIMADRKASAIWEGTLKAGKGIMHFDGYDGPFTFASRFEEGKGTNPEELLGAAHAGCYSMALSAGLTEAGFPPERIETTAHVALRNVDGKATITRSHRGEQSQCARDFTREVPGNCASNQTGLSGFTRAWWRGDFA